MEIMICVAVSAVVSVLVTKVLATHYFEIVDGYVKDICDEAKKNMKSMIHKD